MIRTPLKTVPPAEKVLIYAWWEQYLLAKRVYVKHQKWWQTCIFTDSGAHVFVRLDFVYLIQRLEILENIKPFYNAS